MKVCIVTGGSIEDDFLLTFLKKEKYDVTFAVDSGLAFFYRTHIQPNYIVGDFDSVDPAILSFFQKDEGKLECLNAVKDDTDTEHALHMALEMGCEEVHFFGATGTRLDHVLGNLQLLGLCLRAGVTGILYDTHNKIRLIREKTILRRDGQFGDYVSLIPYTPQVTGLTLQGFKYPLQDHTMSCYYLEGAAPVSGVSNEIVEDEAEISLREGILVLIESRD